MRALNRMTIAAFAAAVFSVCGQGIAQTGSEEAEARKQFEAGVELFEAGQFEQASVAFARAYELRSSFKILYLVGKCENALRHFAASLDAYQRYLSEAGDRIDAARKDEVSKEIARLNALVGMVTVEASVEGATVFVDDERRGETPLTAPVYVDLGKHTVVVKMGAEELHREVVKIAGGQRITVRVEVESAAPAGEEVGAQTAASAGADGDAAAKQKALLIGGIAALAVGAGAGVVGGVFASKRAAAVDDGKEAQSGPKEAYDAAKKDYTTANAVMIGGFVGAGVFVATGAVLLVLHAVSGKKERNGAVSVRPIAGGVGVEF